VSDEDPLVDMALQLSASPPPEPISPAAKARIRSQVLNAYRQQGTPSPHASFQVVSVKRWFAVGIAAMAVLIGALVLVREVSDTLKTSSNITTEPIPTDTVPPTASPLPTTLVIEGVVEAVDANTITVFDMDIEIEPTNPILAEIQVGDHVRIVGEWMDSGDTTIIVGVSIVITERDAGAIDYSGAQSPTLQPGPPIVVPPGCKITGIGNNDPRLKCSGDQDP
jgi:hypothetical protein